MQEILGVVWQRGKACRNRERWSGIAALPVVAHTLVYSPRALGAAASSLLFSLGRLHAFCAPGRQHKCPASHGVLAPDDHLGACLCRNRTFGGTARACIGELSRSQLALQDAHGTC